MSMQAIICPHCGKNSGTSAVNDKIVMSIVHKYCPHCHKAFTWQGINGRVRTTK